MSKNQRLRDQLFILQGSRCFYCDRHIAPKDRTLEHVIPDSTGGEANSDNCAVVCQTVNELLGACTPKQKIIMLKAGGGKIECPKVSRQQLDAHLQAQALLRKENANDAMKQDVASSLAVVPKKAKSSQRKRPSPKVH